MAYNDGYSGDRMAALGSNLRDVNWGEVQVVASQWNYYKPQQQRSDAETAEWLRENRITIYGDRVPQPMLLFSDLVAPDAIHQGFIDLGYKAPTPIQSIAWPILLNSRDLVGVAKTGSGKTMAFMVPAALHIMAQPPIRPGDGPIALVLAPTRELAVQIEEETRKVLRRVPSISTTCLYGGTPKGPQIRVLRAGVHVVIATPGRLIDLLEMHATNLLRVTYLVLDEADRMLDMGFEVQIRKICSQIRADRQTLMFSATWPQEIRNLAASFQRDFIRVHVGSEDLVANNDVCQHVIVVEEYDKQRRLEEILQKLGQQRVLIFVKTKRTADSLHSSLRRILGGAVMSIHGDKEQSQRDYVLDRFRRDARSVLVATDVAARGLDIKNLDVVVNFDMPTNIEDYVHRIGMRSLFRLSFTVSTPLTLSLCFFFLLFSINISPLFVLLPTLSLVKSLPLSYFLNYACLCLLASVVFLWCCVFLFFFILFFCGVKEGLVACVEWLGIMRERQGREGKGRRRLYGSIY
ncbi:putative ATP-dependent DEAD/H RNA helicase [Trypanosoma theileri]|uniref:Probable eukaryotic initiation factor 4A n=1 Tax=Trypanosoma theileri TaxID=67003 RepID=A0A1X0NP86_9TRYP|nr:putative ATP-dependent DEAD/H RNA helicase [Trypanosoma theileri]ORC86526.1 putative ATP-dependent DEAD/H RNA helicase [Trypanosoma theileri]